MQVSVEEALRFYSRLDPVLQAPSLHPAYLLADAQRSAALLPRFFVYQAGEDFYYHAYHMEAVPGTDFFDIQSAYGYGGPVATTADAGFLRDAWEAYSRCCAEENVLVEFMRFHPLLENWRFFSGDVLDDRETVWIDLGSMSSPLRRAPPAPLPQAGEGRQASRGAAITLMDGYTTRVRTAVRKAIKNGLRVEWWDQAAFLAIFPALYEETMRSLDADQSYFFPRFYYEQVTNPELAKLAVCRDDQNIYGAAIFLFSPDMLEYHLSASNKEGKSLGATNLLLHEAATWAQQAGKTRMHLGGGNNPSPDNPLLFYKAGFSGYRSLFKIGKKVHQPPAYAALKDDWEKRNGCRAQRILFYR